MPDLLERVVRAIERVTRLFGHLGAWLVVALVLSMVYEVVMRYAFGAPTMWAYEVGYMLMGTSFMLTIAYAMVTRSHVRVDFVYERLGVRGQALVDLVGYLFFLLPIVTWTCFGLWNYLLQAYASGEGSGQSAWNPVVWPFRVAYVTGFALFVLQTVAEILKCVLVLIGASVPERGAHRVEA